MAHEGYYGLISAGHSFHGATVFISVRKIPRRVGLHARSNALVLRVNGCVTVCLALHSDTAESKSQRHTMGQLSGHSQGEGAVSGEKMYPVESVGELGKMTYALSL